MKVNKRCCSPNPTVKEKQKTSRGNFTRENVLISPAVLKVPHGGPKVTFNENEPLRERIFSFSREQILELKEMVNKKRSSTVGNGDINGFEVSGKQSNDKLNGKENGKLTEMLESLLGRNDAVSVEISSFQSLCALLWSAITRARKLPSSKTTTFRMAVNVRHRLTPKLDPEYFGNAIQSVPTFATAGEVLSRDLRWTADQLNQSVAAHQDGKIRSVVADWEANPRCFPLGNFDGAMVTMGSSPRFPMYDNDFGWGKPVAVRSGRANKFDGKISAFPGRDEKGSVDLEVVLAPETMAGIESDGEFMRYIDFQDPDLLQIFSWLVKSDGVCPFGCCCEVRCGFAVVRPVMRSSTAAGVSVLFGGDGSRVQVRLVWVQLVEVPAVVYGFWSLPVVLLHLVSPRHGYILVALSGSIGFLLGVVESDLFPLDCTYITLHNI
ncbi:hypothetical protein DY000_02002200 [Brassica cretica]|uniref:Acetyltransferase n=1 Tax=Brassica cretica TaxID=69181 RepID=A0ABQ7CEI8_BRACR|nr:hypothetical protein DY000_02002200 [Brassica cretica]